MTLPALGAEGDAGVSLEAVHEFVLESGHRE